MLLLQSYLLLKFNYPIMKKLLLPVLALSAFFGFYEQSKAKPNLYIVSLCIAVFMFSMMYLSAQTPSKNQDSEEEDV